MAWSTLLTQINLDKKETTRTRYHLHGTEVVGVRHEKVLFALSNELIQYSAVQKSVVKIWRQLAAMSHTGPRRRVPP